jgi:hypothetical protein
VDAASRNRHQLGDRHQLRKSALEAAKRLNMKLPPNCSLCDSQPFDGEEAQRRHANSLGHLFAMMQENVWLTPRGDFDPNAPEVAVSQSPVAHLSCIVCGQQHQFPRDCSAFLQVRHCSHSVISQVYRT